jgi:predicted transcriptional regulator
MSDERAQPAAGDAGHDSGAGQGSPPGQGSAAGHDSAAGQGSAAGHDSAGGAWELPWGEPFAANAATAERAKLATAFGAATRRTGSLMQLMGQAAADRIGINATDLNCLNILSFSGQMTAGELARATGLTTASITGVVDRLEEAGFVTRERDPHDRRRVVVKIVLERAVRDVGSVFLPMIRDWQEIAERYSDDELRLIVDFYGRMEEVFRDHIVRLRGTPGN